MPTDFEERLQRIEQKHKARTPVTKESLLPPSAQTPEREPFRSADGSRPPVGMLIAGVALALAVPAIFAGATIGMQGNPLAASLRSTSGGMITIKPGDEEQVAKAMMAHSRIASQMLLKGGHNFSESEAETIRNEGVAGLALRRMQAFEDMRKEFE